MPGLPLEYWVSLAILTIATKAERPLSIDKFKNLMKKMGYARVRVEIDAGKPLKLGILIKGKRIYFGNNLFMRISHRSTTGVGDWVTPTGVVGFQRGRLLLMVGTSHYSQIMWSLLVGR